jgi:hypothetical protein
MEKRVGRDEQRKVGLVDVQPAVGEGVVPPAMYDDEAVLLDQRELGWQELQGALLKGLCRVDPARARGTSDAREGPRGRVRRGSLSDRERPDNGGRRRGLGQLG